MPKSTSQPHPYDSPTGAHPEPLPLLTPADLVNPMITVGEAMTHDPRTCSPQSSLVEVSLIFRDADCGLVPVTEEGRPLGVVTDRDLALEVAHRDGLLTDVAANDVMSCEVETITPDQPLEKALHRLGQEGIRRLLVVDSDDRLVGVLSWADLIPHVSERGLGHVLRQIVEHR